MNSETILKLLQRVQDGALRPEEAMERFANLPYRAGLRSFRVFDRRLLYLEQKSSDPNSSTITLSRVLHAVDTRSGAPLWSYELNPLTIANARFEAP